MAHTHPKRCTSRVPYDHGPVHALPATLPQFSQPEDGRNQDREQNEPHSRSRLADDVTIFATHEAELAIVD